MGYQQPKVPKPTAGNIQNATHVYAADAEASDAYAIAMSPAVTAYVAGQSFTFKANTANTGASSLNVDSLGAKTLKKAHDVDTATGDIEAGSIVTVVYDGTNFQITSISAVSAGDMSDVVDDTTPQLGGALDTNSFAIQFSKGADVASATALPLLTDGNYFDVTGAVTVTSFNTTAVGNIVLLHFDAGLLLTHHASNLILPTGANITTVADDEAIFVEYATGQYRCISYTRATGKALVETATGSNTGDETTATDTAEGVVELATDAEMTTGTATDRAVTPANAKVELDKKMVDVVDDTTPQLGGDLDLNNQSIDFDATPDADHKAVGQVTNMLNAGYTSAIMDLVFLGSGGKWLEADASGVATALGMLGLALEAKTDTQAMKVALKGSFVRDDTWNWTVGGAIYMSETLGALTQTAPSTTDAVVRVVGYAITADVIIFDPSPDHITVV